MNQFSFPYRPNPCPICFSAKSVNLPKCLILQELLKKCNISQESARENIAFLKRLQEKGFELDCPWCQLRAYLRLSVARS